MALQSIKYNKELNARVGYMRRRLRAQPVHIAFGSRSSTVWFRVFLYYCCLCTTQVSSIEFQGDRLQAYSRAGTFQCSLRIA